MPFTKEQFALIEQAHRCLEKVADEVPMETPGIEVEMLYQAFLSLFVLVEKQHN